MSKPLVTISTAPISEDRDHLFTVDNVDYYIPRELPGSLTVAAMAKASEIGDVAATVWVMRQVLGPRAMEALQTCPTIRKAEFLAIQDIVRDRVFGPVEEEGKG